MDGGLFLSNLKTWTFFASIPRKGSLAHEDGTFSPRLIYCLMSQEHQRSIPACGLLWNWTLWIVACFSAISEHGLDTYSAVSFSVTSL